MTRDVCYYFEKDYDDVYNAFYRAAVDKFGKDCHSEEEGKILSFGLNFSFRYNMNGGALRIFFMPYATGTAVNLHYIIAQLFCARYGAHAKELISYVESILGVCAEKRDIRIERFIAYEHLPYDEKKFSLSKYCTNCGNVYGEGDKFCRYCGTKR